MFDSFIINISGIGLATCSVLGARALFAFAVVQITRRRATPNIEEFKRNNTHVGALGEDYRQTAGELLTYIHQSRQMRSFIMEEKRKLKIPNPSAPEMVSDLTLSLKQATVSFFTILKKSYIHRTVEVLNGQVQFKLHAALGKTPGIPTELDVLNQWIADKADQFGITDEIANALLTVSNHIGDVHTINLTGFSGSGAETLTDAAIITNAKAFFCELRLLVNDETSFGDSLAYGAVPFFVRTSFQSLGLAMDAMSGGASLGFFTVTAAWLGKRLGNQSLVDKAYVLTKELERYTNIINKQNKMALSAINGAVTQHRHAFLTQVEKCPDIDKEKSLQCFVQALNAGFENGLQLATASVIANTHQQLQTIPERNWVDRLLGIDRGKEISILYLKAQRDILGHCLNASTGFAQTAEAHPEDAVRFLLDHSIFQNSDTILALYTLPDVLHKSVSGYTQSLGTWESQCATIWNHGCQHVKDTTAREHETLRVVAAHVRTAMHPLKKQLKALRKRLGQSDN